MAHIGKSNKTNWNFVFSSIPGNTVRADEKFKLNIVGVTLPDITMEETYVHFNGTKIHDSVGIEYGTLSVSSIVDNQYENYFIMFD